MYKYLKQAEYLSCNDSMHAVFGGKLGPPLIVVCLVGCLFGGLVGRAVCPHLVGLFNQNSVIDLVSSVFLQKDLGVVVRWRGRKLFQIFTFNLSPRERFLNNNKVI